MNGNNNNVAEIKKETPEVKMEPEPPAAETVGVDFDEDMEVAL